MSTESHSEEQGAAGFSQAEALRGLTAHDTVADPASGELGPEVVRQIEELDTTVDVRVNFLLVATGVKPGGYDGIQSYDSTHDGEPLPVIPEARYRQHEEVASAAGLALVWGDSEW